MMCFAESIRSTLQRLLQQRESLTRFILSQIASGQLIHRSQKVIVVLAKNFFTNFQRTFVYRLCQFKLVI